jgi:hypothetical protein
MLAVDLAKASAAIGRVKSALDAEDGPFSWLTISGGVVAAASRTMSASAPFPWDGEVVVSGKEFEDVLARMPSDPTFSVDGDRLVMRAGRTRGEVRLAKVTDVLVPEAPDSAESHSIDAATLARFEVLSAFVSDDPQPAWMNSLIVQRGRASACGPQAVVYAYAMIPDFGIDALIPKRALLAVLAAKTPPSRILLTANSAAFFWADGAWLSSSVVDGKVPGAIDRLAEKAATASTPPEITPEWREAFVRVAGFAEDEVAFYADRIVGKKGTEKIATVEEGVESAVPAGYEASKWHKSVIDLVVANAEAVDLAAYPAPACFVGPVVRGLVTGRS